MLQQDFIVPDGVNAWFLMVWAQPGAKKDEVIGEHQGRVKIKLNAPAVDNKANKALLKFVARLLGLRQSRIELINGHTSRRKKLRIVSEREPNWAPLSL